MSRNIRMAMDTCVVICKTASHARDVAFALRPHLQDKFVLVTTRNDDFSARVTVMPAYLAKGMEFDEVVIVGADARRYTTSTYDTTLLYIAASRALHSLTVLWTGTPSPLLPISR